MIFLQWTVSVWVVIFFFTTLFNLRRNYVISERMLKATKADDSVKEGDFVCFEGNLTLPPTLTPINKIPCSYWGLIVQAIFYTKKKKPGKGLIEHTPIVDKKSSDELPFLIAKDDTIVQAAFYENMSLLVNAKFSEDKSVEPPYSEISLNAKKKYSSYRSTEIWLPIDSTLSIWGTVASVNKNCITLSASDRKKQPSLIYYGTMQDIKKNFSDNMTLLYILIFWTIFVGISNWTWMPEKLDSTDMIGMIIVCIIPAHFVSKITRKNLSKNDR